MDTVDSGSASEVEDQSKTWGSDAHIPAVQDAHASALTYPRSDCGIGHRVLASRSVLALVIDEECVFAGLQGGDIVAWSLDTYELILSVHAHEESVLGLYLSEDGNYLFSSGGDSVVNVWSTRTFERLYSIYSHHDVGDIFSVVFSSTNETIYCGAQNTSIQWCNLSEEGSLDKTPAAHPSKRTHRFFDSRGPDGTRAPRSTEGASAVSEGGRVLTFKRDHHKLFAHHGYIYAMLLVKGLVESAPTEEALLTGAGDGAVKLWRLGQELNTAPTQIAKLQNGDSVLSIAVEGSLLYCGLAGGALNIWNLDSQQLVKRIVQHTGDLWAVHVIQGVAICGDSTGTVKKFNSRFEEVGGWTAHQGTMLASAVGRVKDRQIYATGGNDNSVGIWDLTEFFLSQEELPPISNDEMVNTLAKFVSFKTISASPKFAGECNQGAAFLRRHCNYLGAKTKLLTTGQDTNPIVFARFSATSPQHTDKTILFYGHYDIVGADLNRPKWNSDPYQLTSINGFLYGRGVSDNKGPILASLYAAADLARTKSLPCNVVFLIEGEEESGSQGFHQTVRYHKAEIGPIDYVLLANSYWLDDSNPCLTYGLRGVVHANLIVTSDHPDLHSGIDGSSLLDEPVKDLSMLVSTLVGRKGKINLPGFHDAVRPLSEAERKRFEAIADVLLPQHPEISDRQALIKSLMYRWREPSLTVHSMEVPGNKSGTTTIARRAKASLSIRIVPDQQADEVAATLTAFSQEQFDLLESQNDLTVEITGKSDAWLGDPDNQIFATLSEAISTAWSPDHLQKSKHQYPIPRLDSGLSASTGATASPGTDAHANTDTTGNSDSSNNPIHLPRQKSSDSLASHVDRVILSSTTTSGKAAARKRSSQSTAPVPTSNTLAKSASTHSTESANPLPLSLPSRTLSEALSSQDTPSTLNPDQGSPSTPLQPSTSISQSQSTSKSPPTSATPPIKPIFIREGGSIPTIRFLEKEFGAPAANLPCGQASDNAHLDNERMRVENLFKSREIFRYVFGNLT
ncbi:Glutathione degradosome Dug2 [Penicillium ucsense]|uniref:Glutathione degradosome Dug2 n=1 Tax=Penicillium ucsense TaxID=2839758 RepID=A0A8J8VWQ1_9EURO|nr:Glutathione degradosome Dug2 [Penicillium ucsense]KAF7734097.1 Glutathione degradosome Dug2 [Penicillium ucsense]